MCRVPARAQQISKVIGVVMTWTSTTHNTSFYICKQHGTRSFLLLAKYQLGAVSTDSSGSTHHDIARTYRANTYRATPSY
jgi:hypothetical protein